MGSSSKSKGTTVTNTVQKPTFDTPEASGLLTNLTEDYSNGGNANTQAAANFLYGATKDKNPYADQVVAGMEASAPRDYAKNLSQVRTAGFRGGVGSDYVNQAGLASDFANTLATNKAKILLDSFNTDRNYQMQGAQSLGDLGSNQSVLGVNLLNTLKGSSSDATTQEKSSSSTIDGGKIAAGVGMAILVL